MYPKKQYLMTSGNRGNLVILLSRNRWILEDEVMYEEDSADGKRAPRCGIKSDSCSGYAARDEIEGGYLEVGDRYACYNCYVRAYTPKEQRD